MKFLCVGLLLLGPMYGTPLQQEPNAFQTSHAFQINSCPKQTLFLVHKGQIQTALELYQNYYDTYQTHDTDFLQQLGLSLLEQGSRSCDPEIQMMALFGAGIAMNEIAFPILGRAIHSPLPPLQLLALSFLGRYHDDEAERYVLQALQSNHLIVRLEALHQIALKKHPKASSHIESLMGKVDSSLLPVFPQLLALVGDNDSLKILRKLLSSPDEDVRVEAIISSTDFGRDDLLPKIRVLAKHTSPALQEASALALGDLKDGSSIDMLERLRQAPNSTIVVRLAALKALYQLGHSSALEEIKSLALYGNPHAIAILGNIPGSENTLNTLLTHCDFIVRANAAIGLLDLKDPRCIPYIAEILIKDSRDLIFIKNISPGKGFIYWKPVTSARQQFKDSNIELELSLHFRESLLAATIDLPEKDVLRLISVVFERQQNDLIPVAIELLERLQTPSAIAMLKQYQQRPGAPLLRQYCNLSLFRMGEEGPYQANLLEWMKLQASENLIQLRPLVPWELDDEHTVYQITPHETSRLLVDTFETIAKKQETNGINSLLEAIKNGNQKNKYALAGLLIRASL